MTNPNDTSDLGQAIQDVTEKLSLLFREEIELAKTEMTEKVTKLIKGAVVGLVAGIFFVFALVYLGHSASWAIYDVFGNDSPWLGFLIVAVLLIVCGALGGLIAARLVKRGAPPTPKMAIEEGKLIKETVTTSHPATPQGPAS
jgi:uncharacterized membrane protein YqjE